MPRLGQSHHNAKLTDAQVAAMRCQYDVWKRAGERGGYQRLAKMFGCGQSTARDIVQWRTRWAV